MFPHRGLLAVVAASLVAPSRGSGSQLPWLGGDGASHDSLPKEAKWQAQFGEKTFFQPTSLSQLSQDVGSYYYAIGSRGALTQELEQSRVGGDDRWHIFHLPEGPSSLERAPPLSGDRRDAVSALVQLSDGVVETGAGPFPEYKLNPDYRNPLDAQAQALEREVIKHVTDKVFMSFLTNITGLNTSGTVTRSWNNPAATKMSEEYLMGAFTAMGLPVCLHDFDFNGQKLGNVVAMIPGTSPHIMVIGAHYDSRPFSGKAPGAEDNGSGVAALLTIAHAFTRARLRPHYTIYFVGFAAEEPGCRGSEAFAELIHEAQWHLLAQQCRPSPQSGATFLQRKAPQRRAIILDEVGWQTTDPAWPKPTVNLESYDWARETGLPEMLDHMAHASHDYNGQALYVTHSNHPFGSDHMSMSAKQIPAFLAINGNDEGYPHYHKSTDTIENVNANYASMITKMLAAGAIRVAGHTAPAAAEVAA